ncbi:hypothetical protein J437_LFUL002209 [Ladona fulva]|uniref:Peroxisomal membrane protein PEX13 n=1 Tax=Ladona fulva TaxID=123851 RepID=A0A8K0NWQ2_LADFU|nr:hypothetical protein J437_LFUL002209 [Ladona fulva]
MTTPMKPWESSGSNLRSDRNGSSLSIQSSSRLPDVNIRGNPAIPPPLPPRPSNITLRRPLTSAVPQVYRSYPTTGNYYGGYNSYGGAYNSYGTYGNYGLYNNMGYNSMGGGQYPVYPFNANDPNNRLIALAEETSRPAFESIEHVVRAFGSVSFMLESTLGALHASFRAALGVAEHLGQLRHILSAVSIFKFLQWIIRRVKVFFGAKGVDGSLGSYWGEAAKGVETLVVNDRSSSSPVPSHWLLGAFLGFVMSGSYLAWRLVSHIVGPGNEGKLSPFRSEENELWIQAKDPNCVFAVACHDFVATTEQELSFRAGQKLIIAPKSRQPYDVKDWLLAAFLWSPRHGGQPKIGLIPENYIRVVERRSIRANGNAAYPTANYSYSPYASHMQGYPQQPLQHPQNIYPPMEPPINVEPSLHAVNRIPTKVQQTSVPLQPNEPKIETEPPISSEQKAEEIIVAEGLPQSPIEDDTSNQPEVSP